MSFYCTGFSSNPKSSSPSVFNCSEMVMKSPFINQNNLQSKQTTTVLYYHVYQYCTDERDTEKARAHTLQNILCNYICQFIETSL